MALKFAPVENPKQMDTEALALALGHLKDSQLMRSLLMAEVEAIRAGADREWRTMRNLWYSEVKPVISRLGILNKTTRGRQPIDWPQKLSVGIAELVRAGETTYEELKIVDGSRQRQPATMIRKTVANVPLVGPHFPWVILFTEKDTIWPDVQAVASLYGVSAISGGGQPSNACTENVIREIMRRDTFTDAKPDSIVLLTLTDYDPAGYIISEAQFSQILEATNGMAGECKAMPETVKHVRLGLKPDQLTPAERQANTYEPKDKGLDTWFEKTDGVDGQPLGLELDALPLSRLRGMFAEGIERHVDLDKRRADLRDAFVDLLACELLKPDFDAKRRLLQNAIKTNGLWRTISDTTIPGSLFKRAAVAGLDSINPVELELFNCADKVRAAMNEALGRDAGQNAP